MIIRIVAGLDVRGAWRLITGRANWCGAPAVTLAQYRVAASTSAVSWMNTQ